MDGIKATEADFCDDDDGMIKQSIQKGRELLESMRMSKNAQSLRTLRTERADVLILEEKVSRMTSEISVLMQEKGVVSMKMGERTRELEDAKIACQVALEEKHEMFLRHERAAKAILKLEDVKDSLNKRVEELVLAEDVLKRDNEDMKKTVESVTNENEAKDMLLKDYDLTKVIMHEKIAQAEIAEDLMAKAVEDLEEKTQKFERDLEEQHLEFERKLEQLAAEKTVERTKEIEEEMYDLKKKCEEKEKKCADMMKEAEEKLKIYNEAIEETELLREEKKKFDLLIVEKDAMEAEHKEFVEAISSEYAEESIEKDLRIEEVEELCKRLTASNEELTSRASAAHGKFSVIQGKLTAIRRGAVDAFKGIDQSFIHLPDDDVRLKYILAVEEAKTAEEFAQICDRRAKDFEDLLLSQRVAFREIIEETRAIRCGEKEANFAGLGYQGPQEVLIALDQMKVELADAKTALENATNDLNELQRVNNLLERRLSTRDMIEEEREAVRVAQGKEIEEQRKNIKMREVALAFKTKEQKDFIKNIMTRQNKGLISLGSKLGVDVEEEEEEEEEDDDNEDENDDDDDLTRDSADVSFSKSEGVTTEEDLKNSTTTPLSRVSDSAEKLTPSQFKNQITGFAFKESPLMPHGIEELEKYISSADRKNLFMSISGSENEKATA